MTQDEGDSRKSEELGDSGRRASKPPGKQEDNARTAEVQTARDQGEDPSSPETGTSGRLSVSGRVWGRLSQRRQGGRRRSNADPGDAQLGSKRHMLGLEIVAGK